MSGPTKQDYERLKAFLRELLAAGIEVKVRVDIALAATTGLPVSRRAITVSPETDRIPERRPPSPEPPEGVRPGVGTRRGSDRPAPPQGERPVDDVVVLDRELATHNIDMTTLGTYMRAILRVDWSSDLTPQIVRRVAVSKKGGSIPRLVQDAADWQVGQPAARER